LVNTGAGLSADTGYWLYRSDSAWNVGLTGQGQNAVILVTGDTNTVEWFVNVRVLATAPIL
jgi:hypothetical protein